jgi:hypothetical protein
MQKTAFTVVPRDDLNPICPWCEQEITEVYCKTRGVGWFVFPPRNTIYFCQHCRKVLGLGQSKMA